MHERLIFRVRHLLMWIYLNDRYAIRLEYEMGIFLSSVYLTPLTDYLFQEYSCPIP